MSRDLGSLWHIIEDELAHSGGAQGVRRLVPETGAAEVHIGVSGEGRRQVWVRLPDSWAGDVATFPRWRGARIRTHIGTERPHPRTFIILEQADGTIPDVFITLAAYLCRSFELAEPGTSVTDGLTATLDAWRVFFEAEGLDGLTREAQQGLWGELWVLREHIIPRLGLIEALEAWTGSDRTNHDFQRRNRALEVKTTSGRRHHSMRIKSERQLDTTGLASLHVLFLTVARIDNGGETLPAMVDSLRRQVSAQPSANRRLEEQLLAARYLDNHAHDYRTGFACRDARAFEVDEGFPRLTEGDLPDGVGDVNYGVSLDACAEWQVDFATAIDAFAPARVVTP